MRDTERQFHATSFVNIEEVHEDTLCRLGTEVNGVRAINLNFGEGSEETIISPAKIAERADAWYTIDGVKLNGKPNVKGLYINNGRKVVIK